MSWLFEGVECLRRGVTRSTADGLLSQGGTIAKLYLVFLAWTFKVFMSDLQEVLAGLVVMSKMCRRR